MNNPQDKCLEPVVCVSLCKAYLNYRFSEGKGGGGWHDFPRMFGEGKAARLFMQTNNDTKTGPNV